MILTYTVLCVCVGVQLNAMANRAAGKGYENEDHYTNIKLQFIGIENIHVMRSSQQKIIDGKRKYKCVSIEDKCCVPYIGKNGFLSQWRRLAFRVG